MGRTDGGRRVTWSVAEGRRGRRWRESVADDRGQQHALLLETDPDGRFSHLELATSAGLLTLHPEPDGTLHGNAVVDRGLRHVAGLPWDRDGLVVLPGSPVAAGAVAELLRHVARPGASIEGFGLRVLADLGIEVGPLSVERLDEDTWRVDDGLPFRVDASGLPLLADAETWPLDLPAG